MKISKLRNVAWVLFALILTSTTVFAQGWRNGNRAYQTKNDNCLISISGLSEKQQTQIQGLENKHHDGMAELREKRRSTTNAIEKSEIRTEMLKKVEAHRNSVKKVLNADQQKQYEQLHTNGYYGGTERFGNGHGNADYGRCGNGNGNFSCRGNGNGNRNSYNGNRGVCGNQANSRGRGGNYQQGNGRGNGNRANFGRGHNRNFRGGSCVNTHNVDTCGFKTIESTDEKF